MQTDAWHGRSCTPYNAKCMNVYDFDNTLYDGESTFDFFLFCLKRRPRLLRWLASVLVGLVRYKMRLLSREGLKTLAERNMFGLLHACPDYAELVEQFWNKNISKIKPFYSFVRRADDVVLTASFDFLIEPCMRRMGIQTYVCSSADLEKGQITRLCFRENKPACLEEVCPGAALHAFYTDSLNDLPLLRRAEKAYLVRGDRFAPLTLSAQGGVEVGTFSRFSENESELC